MEFKNYPDTTTPLNATNLNKLVQKNAIKSRMSNAYTLQQTNEWEKLPLSYKETYVGNQINIDATNNKIIIGEGINYILVSAQIYWGELGATGKKLIKIVKNNDDNIICQSNTNISTTYMCHTIPSILVPVQQNDTIYLLVRGTAGDNIPQYGSNTYVTVVAVG